jgi:hypothetical protein
MLDGFPQPAAKKSFKLAFFFCRSRLVRFCDTGADLKIDRFRFHG